MAIPISELRVILPPRDVENVSLCAAPRAADTQQRSAWGRTPDWPKPVYPVIHPDAPQYMVGAFADMTREPLLSYQSKELTKKCGYIIPGSIHCNRFEIDNVLEPGLAFLIERHEQEIKTSQDPEKRLPPDWKADPSLSRHEQIAQRIHAHCELNRDRVIIPVTVIHDYIAIRHMTGWWQTVAMYEKGTPSSFPFLHYDARHA